MHDLKKGGDRMRITKSISYDEEDQKRIKRLQEMTYIRTESKLVRLAVRYCLFNIKGFTRFLSHGQKEEI